MNLFFTPLQNVVIALNDQPEFLGYDQLLHTVFGKPQNERGIIEKEPKMELPKPIRRCLVCKKFFLSYSGKARCIDHPLGNDRKSIRHHKMTIALAVPDQIRGES